MNSTGNVSVAFVVGSTAGIPSNRTDNPGVTVPRQIFFRLVSMPLTIEAARELRARDDLLVECVGSSPAGFSVEQALLLIGGPAGREVETRGDNDARGSLIFTIAVTIGEAVSPTPR